MSLNLIKKEVKRLYVDLKKYFQITRLKYYCLTFLHFLEFPSRISKSSTLEYILVKINALFKFLSGLNMTYIFAISF